MMKTIRITAVMTALFLVAGTAAIFAQDKLPAGTAKPVVDGVVKSGEYSYTHDFDQQLTLSASRTSDTLYFGVVGNTSGWVAVGLGSERMDGAAIFIGYVGADGKVQFKPQLGKGHRHGEATSDISGSVVSYAMKEAGGKTTLEIAVKAADFVKAGQGSLDVIFGEGDQKSFTQYHTYRGATSLALK
jgi:hypothetical protein